jgi:hypothetical protein
MIKGLRRTLVAIVAPSIVSLLGIVLTTQAQVKVTVGYNNNADASSAFKFKNAPSPVADDAGAKAKLSLVDGQLDQNGADLGALTDGIVPTEEDQPDRNVFFDAGTGGGRFRLDLGGAFELAQVNTYSWHLDTRGPQVYRLWTSDGTAPRFNGEPKGNVDPATCGWKLIAVVDTRKKDGKGDGGQYGVSITDASGSLGKYRYLLFDCYVTETGDDFGNTFYSEVDVIVKK